MHISTELAKSKTSPVDKFTIQQKNTLTYSKYEHEQQSFLLLPVVGTKYE